jgi:hypothetical protein
MKSRNSKPQRGPDVTAVLNFHAEDMLGYPAIQSFASNVKFAADAGIRVKRVAILDKPSRATEQLVRECSEQFDEVVVRAFGDLGKSRASALELAEGRYLCFFDGDDLWGKEWIARAHAMLESNPSPTWVAHPEVVYYFSPEDFLSQSPTPRPSPNVKSFFLIHHDSRDPAFDRDALRFNNVYTSNTFAPIELFEKHPFIEVDAERGFGVEDWAWNAMTLGRGIEHVSVQDTVHLVRVKASASLGKENASRGLLPPLHLYFGE